MAFVYLDNFLTGRGLKLPNLIALKPDVELYNTAIFQPAAELFVTMRVAPFLKCTNEPLLSDKFKKFFILSNQNNCALAIAPEYSLPWLCLSEIIANGIQPNVGSIWLSGCEPITPRDLSQFIANHSTIEWIYDEGVIDDWNVNDVFFDAACYLFFCDKEDGSGRKLVSVLQFKTHPLGGSDFEDQMIKGKQRYIIKNDGNSIRLATIVCSDALNFDFSHFDQDLANHLPLLLLHIQLTPDSRSDNFTKYRHDYLNKVGNDNCNKEIICANWAKGTSIRDFFTMVIGGSAQYGKYKKSISNSQTLNNNETLGAHYSFFNQSKTSAYYFNYKENILIFKNHKVDQSEAPIQNHHRNGLTMSKFFSWNLGTNTWNPLSPSCGLAAFCQLHFGATGVDAIFNAITTQINKERFILVSNGEIGNLHERPWFEPDHHKYFQIERNEIINRSTFEFEYNPNCVNDKIRRISLVRDFKNKLETNALPFPENIMDLQGSCVLQYNPNEEEKVTIYFNLYHSNQSSSPAIGVYLGSSSESRAEEVFSNIQDSLRRVLWKRLDPNDEEAVSKFSGNQVFRRIAVWYEDQNHPLVISDSSPTINDKNNQSSVSINRTGKL